MIAQPPTHSPSISASLEDAASEGQSAFGTLVTIRWISILGQLSFVLAAYYLFDIDLELGACVATIAIAAIINIGATFHRRHQKKLKPLEALLYPAFDIMELSLLISLTGGLDNPFAIFLVAPVAAAASLLRFRQIAALTMLTVVCLTVNAIWHTPLPWTNGALEIPPMYGWVMWFSLSVSAIFIASYSWTVTRAVRRTRIALTATQMELASANQMTAMGALAAAVAHELGTPLATISLVAKELLKESGDQDEDMKEDLELLVSQSERCRKVLADFGQKPSAEGGAPYQAVPLSALIEDIALPHNISGKGLEITASGTPPTLLLVHRQPELIHGIGNVIQNAFQFAASTVRANISWTPETVTVCITDNGPGFPASLLQKVGQPYISTRSHTEGGHMGLGIFISKTLLERTGANVVFANGAQGGAKVTLTWARTAPLFVVT